MTFRLRLLLAAWVAAATLAAPALAQPLDPRAGGMRPGGPPPMRARGLERMVAQLGLDEGTQQAVDQVLEEAHTRRESRRQALREEHEKLRALLEADEPDEDAILSQADAIGLLETEARKDRLRTLLRVRALLPPEAREQLLTRMRERGPRRGGPRMR